MGHKPSNEGTLLTKLMTETKVIQAIMDELIELAKMGLSPEGTQQRSSASAIVRITTLQTQIKSWIGRKNGLDQELADAFAEYKVALHNSIVKGEMLSKNEVRYLENIKDKDYLLLEKEREVEAERNGATANEVAQEDIRQLNKDKRELSAKLKHMLDKYQHLTQLYDALKVQAGRQQGFTTVQGKLHDQYDDEEDSSRPSSAKRKRSSNYNSPTLFVDSRSIEELNLSDVAESALAARRYNAKSKSKSSSKSNSKSPLLFNSNASQRANNEPFKFPFTAIMSYDPVDGSVKEYKPSNAFNDSLTLSYVRDRIAIILRTIWEPELGDTDVCFLEFEADHDAGMIPRCITSVAEHRKTKWRAAPVAPGAVPAQPSTPTAAADEADDEEPGWKYACKDCVENGLPCFVFGEDGLTLLPFHPEDRPKKMILPGQEAWYWVNLDKEVNDDEEDEEDVEEF